MRKINKIIVHCSATPEGKPFTIDDIRKWHTKPRNMGGKGWQDIGYHYVIHLDGSIHKGRPEEMRGAHCAGHNAFSIGVCYIGGTAADGKTPKDTRTPQQKEALLKLVGELLGRYPEAQIFGHNDFSRYKACPCFDAKTLCLGTRDEGRGTRN